MRRDDDVEIDEALGSYNFDELDPEEEHNVEIDEDHHRQQTSTNPLPFDHGLSNEDYDAIFKRVHPTSSSQWRNSDPPSAANVFATVDGARQIMWQQAQNEINFVRSKIQAAVGKEKPEIIDLVELFFGTASQIGRLMEYKLKMKNDDFQKVLATFFIASSYNASTKSLFSKDSFIDTTDLATETEYRDFWRGISDYGIPRSNLLQTGNSALIVGARPLWMDFEAVINDLCRDLFVSGFPETLRITIDDDKMHYDKHSKKDTQSLKRMKHVRDNVNGFVCHTAGYTASGLPMGLVWERSHDDTGAGAAQRLLRSQLSPAIGLNGVTANLTKVDVSADRGYMTPEVLYDYILESGANVLGTVKRSPMFPFTFDQKLRENDKREDVPTKGFKALLQKKVTYKSKVITAVAYRDGTGGVTLGITSRSQGRHWDLVLRNAKDANRYKINQRTPRSRVVSENEEPLEEPIKWYNCILSQDEHSTAGFFNEIYEELLQALPVTPFTLFQNTPKWFLLRILSLTSSTSDRVIRKLMLMLLNRDYRSTFDRMTATALRRVLNIVHGEGWDVNTGEDPSVPEAVTPEPDASTDQRVAEECTPVVIDGEHVSLNVRRLLSLETGEEEEATRMLQSRLTTLPIEILKGYVTEIGSKPSRDRKQNEVTLKKWLDESPRRRAYIFLTVKQLADACVAKFGGAKSTWTKDGRDKLIEKLALHHHEQRSNRTAASPHESNASVFRMCFKQIMLTSFMTKLTAKGKEYCKAGQRLEIPFARKLMEHSKSGITKFPVERVYQVGLVGKSDAPYAKASCDFIAGILVDGAEELVGVECKARVASGTAQRERMLAEALNGFMDFLGTEIYTVIEAASSDFKEYIENTHEAIQILHQAYVCSFRYVLLLVGDLSGTIIRGVWVCFDQELLKAYGEVLAYVYKQALQWAYEPALIPIPKDQITLVLQEDLKQTIDYESFIGYYYLWQYIIKKLPLPLPRLARIVPFIMSLWNAGKGVSDTVSKLVWMNIHDPPCNTVQGHAISRMLLIVATIIHRLNHFFTAKPNLLDYPSLPHFRNACSHRSTFHETLNDIIWTVKLRSRPTSIPRPQPASRGITGALTRRGDTRNKIVAWGSERTGATPQKNLKQFYSRSESGFRNSSELEFHERQAYCTGNPLYRISFDTKNPKGAGSRGTCAICNKISNVWCMGCHRFLCNIGLPANRSESIMIGDDPKYITLEYEREGENGKEIINVCGFYSCWHKGHQAALDAEGATERGWTVSDSAERSAP